MVEAIKEMFQLDFAAIVLAIFIIMSGVIAMYTIIGKFSQVIGKPVAWVRKKNEDHDKIKKLEDEMKKLLERQKSVEDIVDQYNNHRVHDREQSRDIQKELINSINNVLDKLNDLKTATEERFFNTEKKENERVQAEIKDKIAQSYRHYSELQQISSMEKEALEDLIKTYEAHGGTNSFVHSVVQKEMYQWEVIQNS